jgi:hypothetical protein
MLLNPIAINKVSCFENFKDLAFSVGEVTPVSSLKNTARRSIDTLTTNSEDIP